MIRIDILLAVSVVVASLSVTGARGDDWPQWLGPRRDSVWRESGIVTRFPAEGPRAVWRAEIGAGFSGPSVANARVYITDRMLEPQSGKPADPFARGLSQGVERVLCLDEATGKLLWTHEYPCRYTISYGSGPRVQPLVEGDRVYTLGAEGHLLCLDKANGKPVWSRNLKEELAVKTPMWGFAGHPLIDGNKLICLAAGNGSTAIAFEKSTGKELWRALSSEEPGYSSPMITEAAGTRQLIVIHGEAANSLDPETGKVLWSVPFKSQMGLCVATPRRLGDLLFFTSFYNGSLMLRLDSSAPRAAALWRTEKGNERNTTHLNAIIPTPFLENGFIYGICSYGQLRCLKADTGERVWESLQPATRGEPVRWANAFLVKHEDRFFLFNEQGDLIIADLAPSGYREISRAHLIEPTNKDPGRPVVWSHPAFANRRVYVRNDREIACFSLGEP